MTRADSQGTGASASAPAALIAAEGIAAGGIAAGGADSGHGYLETIAIAAARDCHVLTGWVRTTAISADTELDVDLAFEFGPARRRATIALFDRADVRSLGRAFVLLVDGPVERKGELIGLTLRGNGRPRPLALNRDLRRLTEADATTRARQLLRAGARSPERARILATLTEQGFKGEDTLHTLALPVMVEIDCVYLSPANGIVLRGWWADPFEQVVRMRFCCGPAAIEAEPARMVPIARPDVVRELGAKFGFRKEDCGFLIFLPEFYRKGAPLYCEIETRHGEIAYRLIPAPNRGGAGAARDILDSFEAKPGKRDAAFDAIGPAIASLGAARAAPAFTTATFGPQPARPVCSLVIPLHGRFDFLQYQLSAFRRMGNRDLDILYVVDQPERAAEAGMLARASALRFGIGCRLVLPEANLGFGPASNLGLSQARAPVVCFLNSDVFPADPHWLAPLLESVAPAEIGAVGPLLLFEDGSVQHQGVTIAPAETMDGWYFAQHPNKGGQPGRIPRTSRVPAVTGACLVMRTATAREFGGFDPRYLIGDFEDVDLCFRLREAGLDCVVDARARLYHLERQSQGDSAALWRRNLTVYNAWRFQRRWFGPDGAGVALARNPPIAPEKALPPQPPHDGIAA